ncbi:nuclear speckle RNA-binding protein A isoform X3 [Eutrema salsugineum]|uniref:nuclear speckle RNA-binding protein A isoform X3 n=1 Tax=Eutrema salsugineum TaxID=72664 RepID=UPI000CED46EE|nr:nuclear speckle RNA-binding protein A isoform X3 [Eutrema salsugineum]
MADGYWNQQRQHPPPGGPPKRRRSDFEALPSAMPSGHEMHGGYFPRDEDLDVPDTRTIGSAYDRYLQSQTPSMQSGEAGHRNGVAIGRTGGNGQSMGEFMMRRGGVLPPDHGPDGRALGFDPQESVDRRNREPLPLPPDASNTLYVEGLPSNCSRREVAHIFRPFVGYREVRLVTKDSKHRNGDPIVLCFVDFTNPACAATALSTLQGYRMDESEPDSKFLRLQFSRKPGSRPGQRGRR